ncbi:MAG: metalloregulator ArsR/SmtB family transcription factor [Anaerolineales bacterium]|jgi:DNA-binding transcriptional ArsR family regulator
MDTPKITWEWGTAYDLFASLHVLHEPDSFGLRASWAAGVRSRLPSEERELLEATKNLVFIPLHWIHDLPDPKDSTTALWALAQIPREERLAALTCCPDMPSKSDDIFQTVAAKGSWDSQDLEALQAQYKAKYKEKGKSTKTKELTSILDLWAQPGEFGERYLNALRAYHQAFFAEEEKRITPALKTALNRAQELAERLSFEDLVEELSQGLRLEAEMKFKKMIFAPSYWITPLVVWDRIAEDEGLFLFGARPDDASLVPGEVVPDSLLRMLKALADPTRLKILRYLVEDSLTPAELARRLRLRAPTVTHHLKTLRLAGLVHITFEERGERLYASRLSAVSGMCESLYKYIGADVEAIVGEK